MTEGKTYMKPGHEIMETHEGGKITGRTVVRYLASGSFGDVYEVRNDDNGKSEAMKMVTLLDKEKRPLPEKQRVEMLRPHLMEAHFMLKLGRHPNLVGILAAFQIDNDFYFFEDLVPGGISLRSVIQLLTNEEAAMVAFKMAKGLAYMHDTCKLRHFDVKPDNVLVEIKSIDDNNNHSHLVGAVKLTDFGGCDLMSQCTPEYSSPEIRDLLTNLSHGGTIQTLFSSQLEVAKSEAISSQDQWSWGVVVIEMFTGKRVDYINQVPQIDGDDYLRKVCIGIARKCLNGVAKKRPNMSNVQRELHKKALKKNTTLSKLVDDSKVEKVLSPDELFELHSNIGLSFMLQVADFDLAYEHLSVARDISQKNFGTKSSKFATGLNNLALLLEKQGEYDEAKPLYERAIEIWEKVHGPNHPEVATGLNNLALEIGEKTLGPNHPDVAFSLNNLAELLKNQGKYDEAKPLYERSIKVREQKLGPNHPDVATPLSNLAELLKDQGKYDEAKQLYERALEISEKTYGPNHQDLATTLNNLAWVLQAQGKYDEAEQHYQRALKINEEALGLNHPDVVIMRDNLTGLLMNQKKYKKARPLIQHALDIFVARLPPQHPHIKIARMSLNDVDNQIRKSRNEKNRKKKRK
eukprot:CAMPEP_0197302774 /NCGR_PEP_ID=MMETSP0890-20130614/51260_1 /TAXON_ID=44058 ORGANISM="Aureoumbra lagunensis, Strain CCMP1510" /NCGR_SAMPLE_ID=MMETSP0890 /ASSEMBLY_ACC=CAM_ASM_000533 /LENGTH=633 /DNA_ID=CAMNT_0042782465 /DNA_START=287 /DNA_END=2188 /DNA_ORIENTATION=+